MRILILGYGFIGKYIAHQLESQGYEVLIFSRNISITKKHNQIQGDVFKDDDLDKVISWQPTIIISTVWSTNHDSYSNDSNNINYANFSISLVDFCNRIGVKHLIVLGSGAEYGNPKMASSAGATVLNPLSIYAAQKVYAFNSIKEIDKKTFDQFQNDSLYSSVSLTFKGGFSENELKEAEKKIPGITTFVNSSYTPPPIEEDGSVG